MTTRTLGGWALLTNAALALVLFFAMSALAGGDTIYQAIGEVLSLTLVIGLVAIWSMLPHTELLGRLGLIGLWYLGISTAIAFVVRLAFLFTTIDVGEVIPFSSAAFGLVGCLLVGGVTIRTKAFHSVFGWLLIVFGVLNLVGGLLPQGVVTTVLGGVGLLASVGAMGGYGWVLLGGSRGGVPLNLY